MIAGMMRSGSSRANFLRVETAGVTESMSCASQWMKVVRRILLTLLNMAVSASGRRVSTNSRLISGVRRQLTGVLHEGSSSDFQRSTKLPARWDKNAVRNADQCPELLGWKN